MIEKGDLLHKELLAQLPLKIYKNGIEGYFIYSQGWRTRSKKYFRTIDDFIAIYSWHWDSFGVNTNYGFQLETKKEVFIISSKEHNIKKIEPLLKRIFKDKWKKIYMENNMLNNYKSPGKIGQVGIHHSWKYYGFWKGWR